MRDTLLFSVTLLVSAAAVAAETPIPQDTARMEQHRRERLEWNRRTLQGAYDKVGKRDPRWDETARKAMDLAARMFSEQVDPEVTHGDVHQPARDAVKAGCDDPLLVYLYNRSLVGPDYPGEEEMIRRTRDSAQALGASRYPPYRRAVAQRVAGTTALAARLAGDALRKEPERHFDAALALLPESVATEERDTFWEDGWLKLMQEALRGYRTLGIPAVAAYERVDAALARLPEVKDLRLKLRGFFWHTYGWEARTTAFAPNVPAGGFETLEKRVALAQKALTEAWQLRPDDAWTAGSLLDIEKTVGGDRKTMELWFDRAMKADGDNFSACLTKLDWLDPKWHGSVEEMLAFGAACRATKNWRAGITLLAGDAHFRYVAPLEPAERTKYLGSTEVWTEIKLIYDEYLSHHTHDDLARSKYAALSFMAGHYLQAQAQFQALGDRLTVWPIFPNLPLESLKQMRDAAARFDAARPRGDDPLDGWLLFYGVRFVASSRSVTR